MWVFLSTQSISCSFVRFFFWQKKRKRKSLAKRKARIRDFASAEATNAPRVGSAVAFGKATQNLFGAGFASVAIPINQNIIFKPLRSDAARG